MDGNENYMKGRLEELYERIKSEPAVWAGWYRSNVSDNCFLICFTRNLGARTFSLAPNPNNSRSNSKFNTTLMLNVFPDSSSSLNF